VAAARRTLPLLALLLPPGGAVAQTAELVVEPVDRCGLDVVLDASGSEPAPGGDLLRFRFDPGDGTPPQTVEDPRWPYAYRIPGGYVARVTVEDASGSRREAAATVRAGRPESGVCVAPPLARIARPPAVGTHGSEALSVLYVEQGEGPVVAVRWDFGDGTAAGGEDVSHRFSRGVWQVRLTAVDAEGLAATDRVTVVAGDTNGPALRAYAVPGSDQVRLLAELDDADGRVATVSWRVNTGARPDGTDVTVDVATFGVIVATCLARDAEGRELARDEVVVTLADAPDRVPPRIVSLPPGPVGDGPFRYQAAATGSPPLVWSLVEAQPNTVPADLEADPDAGLLAWAEPDADLLPLRLLLRVDNSAGYDEQGVLLERRASPGDPSGGVARAEAARMDAGCACRAGPGGPPPWPWLLPAAALWAWRRRRRGPP